MGFFSWISTTAKKSVVAALIQEALELLERGGGILDFYPESLANRMVEAAFTRLPNLTNAKYNKHVLAMSILAMVPALPSFSKNERESSKHALGILLKHVLELQMSNSLALTLFEQGLLERAQQTFLAAMEPSPGFNLGPNFNVGAPYIEEEVFSRQDKNAIQALCDAMNMGSGQPAYFDIVPLTANASSVGIGLTHQTGERVLIGSIVKSTENNLTTVTLRGLNASELPDAPQTFPSVEAALSFSFLYFEFMSTEVRS